MLLGFCCLFFVFILGEGARYQSQCPEITIKFGRPRYKNRGRLVKYVCNTGYMLVGDRYSTCVRDQWDTDPPKCVKNSCNAPKTPINGLIYPTFSGAVLNFFCKPGYELLGQHEIYCDGTNWNNAFPICKETNSVVKMSCDFETADLCGWSHDPNHDFDWMRWSKHTPSRRMNTGPQYDHTKGESNEGYYMYIESSLKQENDTARLISPVYPKNLTDQCFRFYYHMFGATIGSLRVYVKKVSEDWNLIPSKALWSKSGNQGDHWFEGYVSLGQIDDDFQIIIEGVSGLSYISDIAIDDVSLETCTTSEITSTSEWPLETEEPFEYQSCEGRCSSASESPQNSTKNLISCDCNDACFAENNCCPDFFHFCVDAYFAWPTLNDESTTLQELPTTVEYQTKVTTSKAPPITTTTIKRTTTKLTTYIPRITTRSTIPPTPILTTTKMKKTTESKIVYVKPETRTEYNNDMIELLPQTTLSDKIGPLQEYNEDKKFDMFSENIPELHRKTDENPVTLDVIIIVCSLIGGFCSLLAVFIVYRRYRCSNFSNIRRHATGDSQSDVRFLTSDEILDLNLPGNYDTL